MKRWTLLGTNEIKIHTSNVGTEYMREYEKFIIRRREI